MSYKLLSSKQVVSIIEKGNPLSIIRYGDAEAIVLNGDKDTHMLEFICKKQLGFIPSNKELYNLKENLIEAFKNCDIIGVAPKIKAVDGTYWGKAEKIMKDEVGLDFSKSNNLCSMDIHTDLLDNGMLSEILLNQETVNYISCRNIDVELKRKYNIKKINSFIISPEAKYSSQKIKERHYPNQFNRIKKWMRTINCKNNICLVGAGLTGKIYCNWFKEEGGITIDIGSVFDLWVGKVTRGQNRGVNSTDDKYKL